MDLLWTVLLVFLVCVEAKKVTEVQAELGQNVTLSCSLDAQDIYWYIEINSEFKACIAWSIRNGSDGQYYVSTSRTKYVVIKGNSLVITNITSEDYRLYFCARRLGGEPVFEETFSIVSNVSTTPPTTTTSVTMTQPQQPIREIWQSEPVVYSSFALNVLFLVVTGLVFTFLSLKKKNCNYQVNDPSPFTCGNSETLESPQYEEIQFSTSRPSTPAALHIECIYSKAQPSRSTLSRHLGHLDAYQTPGQ